MDFPIITKTLKVLLTTSVEVINQKPLSSPKNTFFQVGGFNHVLSNLYPHHNILHTTQSTITAAAKLKDAAKSASELAKSKAVPIYASLHPNQS